jgi:hypothetical protein
MLPSVHSMLPAMVIMVVPSFFVCAGIAWLAWRKRDQSGGE